MAGRFIFLLAFCFVACTQRSNDPLLNVQQEWVDSDYILNQSGDSEELAVLQAREWMERNEFRRAWQVLNKPSLRYAVNADISFLKGKAQYAMGNYSQAIGLLEDAEQLGFKQQELNELLVRTNLALHREENAKGISKTLVEQQPSAINMNLRAQVLLATGDTTGARQTFNSSLKLDSGIRENYLGLGAIYQASDSFEKAKSLMSDGVKRFSADEEVLTLYASILEEAGDYRDANKVLGELLTSDPNDATLLSWRARLYLGSRQYDSAVYAATASLINEENADTRLVLATSLERQRLYSDALGMYQQVYDADSTNARAADGVKRLEGRRRYLEYLRKQRQDSVQQQSQTTDATPSNG